MSNYSKTTDFEAKDSLPTGDSGKIIRGAEFETEFDAISTAIATKADTAGPTFTGTLTFETISDGTIGVTAFVDEDDMSSDSATLVPTQQSVKAYVDSQVTAQDLDFQADTGGALSIDLDSETLTFTGGTGIDTSGLGNAVTFAIDSTVATLTGTQTLTNKTLTSPDVNTPDIDGGTIDGTVIGGTTPAAVSATTVSATGNITVDGTVDGRDVATDGTKLDGIESGATADQTAAEIRTLVEAATDSNVFTDADHSKLDGIEAGATGDQTNAEIRAAVEAATDSNVFTDADHSKLDGIEALADVTDTANVTAAGALMDSELTSEASVKALNQGVATTDSPTFAGVTVNGTVEFDGLSGTGAVNVTDILDQDDMSSNSATALATQQSIKAYVDTTVAATNELVEDTTPQLGGDLASNGNDILFADNDKAIFGAGSDLQIYHSGSHSFISEAGTGDLYIGASSNIALMNAAFSENKLLATTDGALKLYYDGSQKFATTSTGIDVTGVITTDGMTTSADINFGDNDKAIFGAGSDLQIYHNGNNSYVQDAGTGKLHITSDGTGVSIDKGTSELMATFDTDGAVTLYHDNSAKLATTSTGIDITGNATFDDNGKAIFGAGSDLEIYHDGSNSYIDEQGTGSLNIRSSTTLRLQNASGTNYLYGTNAGEVVLYYNGSPKLYTASTGIDVTGSISADGLTVDGQGKIQGTFALLDLVETDITDKNTRVITSGGQFRVDTVNDALSSSTKRIMVDHTTGDISFYEDTGTTAKLFWDASAESLGIGTSSPSYTLDVRNSADAVVQARTTTNASGNDAYFRASLAGANAGDAFVQFDIDSVGGYALGIDNSDSDKFKLTYGGPATPSSGTTLMTVDSSGNVGIGTSSIIAGARLDVRGANSNNLSSLDAQVLTVQDTASYAANIGGGIAFGYKFNSLDQSIQRGAVIKAVKENATDGDYSTSMAFATVANGGQTTEKMRIDSSGNLLVGTTSAFGTTGTTINQAGLIFSSADGDRSGQFDRTTSDGEIVRFTKAGSTVGSISTAFGYIAVGTGDTGISFRNDLDSINPFTITGNTNRGAAIDLGADGTRFKDLYLSGIIYGVQQTLTRDSGAPLELNRTTNDGELVYFKQSGIVRGSISISGSTTSYNTTSDYRLKENVVAMSGATERLKQLNPSRFNFVGDTDTTVDGFLAHEVANVVPEAITGAKDAMRDEEYEVTPAVLDDDGNVVTEAVMGTRSVPDYQGIDQSKLVPLLVATIQELEARIAALESN